jgi:probable HAF family extracellular repeat protein
MRARHRLSLFLLSVTVGLANAAWAAPEYRLTVVGPADSVATDINNAGVVVGRYPFSATATHAFLNRGAGLVDLGARTVDAVAINNNGKVLGHWKNRAGEKRGFVYYSGSLHDIGTIPGRDIDYTDINNAGYITAYGALTDTFEGAHAFLRAPDGTFQDIGALPFDNPMTAALALNKQNQIAGFSGPLTFPDQPWRAITWRMGVMQDLGDFGMDPNVGQAINDCGQITGYASLTTGFRNEVAFIWTHGRMVNIDGRPDTEERYSAGYGINCHGHVVGTSNHLSGFIYRGRRMQSLNALIDPTLGWDVFLPKAINDSGQIAASAYRRGVRYAVRLDLIRPMTARVLELHAGDDAAPPPEPVDEKLDAAAQAREVVRPVRQ